MGFANPLGAHAVPSEAGNIVVRQQTVFGNKTSESMQSRDIMEGWGHRPGSADAHEARTCTMAMRPRGGRKDPMNVIECPHCYTRVAVMAEGTCPSCRKPVNDTEGTNPDLTALTVHTGRLLPLICYHCGSPAIGYSPIVVEKPAEDQPDRRVLMILSLIIESWLKVLVEIVVSNYLSNERLTVQLPHCKECKIERPTYLYVNFEEDWVRFVVHKRLRQEVEGRTSA
jgi:hypothetical protein